MNITITYCNDSSDAKIDGSNVFDFPFLIHDVIVECPGV